MMLNMSRTLQAVAVLGMGALGALASPGARADSISPTSFSADLGVGASTTVRKTVVVSDAPTSALIDVVFLIDTSGSMGSAIAGAKTAASNILTGLSALGNVASGTGFYSEPGSDGVFRPLTTTLATGIQNINDITLGLGGGGGDFPEEGFHGTKTAAEGQAWRAGSNRFIVALGDATFKESDGSTQANTLSALAANNVTFIGIDFGNMTNSGFGGESPEALASATGGSIQTSTTDPDDIVAAILASVSSSFLTYSEVTVSDLGAGAPEIGVSVTCVSADTGACVGDKAVGTYDRSINRTFEFDVTFTRLAAGDKAFSTLALVDGGAVATESDRFGGAGDVPAPASLLLLGAGLAGLGVARRRAA